MSSPSYITQDIKDGFQEQDPISRHESSMPKLIPSIQYLAAVWFSINCMHPYLKSWNVSYHQSKFDKMTLTQGQRIILIFHLALIKPNGLEGQGFTQSMKITSYHLWFKSKDPHVWGKKTGSKFKSFCRKWKVNPAPKQHNNSSVVAIFFADDIIDTSLYSKLLYITEMLPQHYHIPLLNLYFSFL